MSRVCGKGRGAGMSAALPGRPPRRSCRPCIPFEEEAPLMEQLLIKMARQLDALDEASLLALWDKYAAAVSHFEPTKRWEEAALVLSFIQAKRWKNQLFNYSWSAQVHPGAASQPVAEPGFFPGGGGGAAGPARARRAGAVPPGRPPPSPWRRRGFSLPPRRKPPFAQSPGARPRSSRSARTAARSRMPPKSPAEKAEDAGKPFFRPDSR